MSCEVEQSQNLEQEESDSTALSKKGASSHYLDQLKATIECDRRIHALISLYTELQKRVDAVEFKVNQLAKM